MTPLAVFLHAFGQRYDLPISLALYLYAAGGVVVISFVMVVAFAGDKVGERALDYPTWRVPLLDRLAASRVVRALGGVLGVLVLLASIVTGLFGTQDPNRNPSEYLVWIYFWAGFVILTGLVGNVWGWVNPFRALESLVRLAYNPRSGSLPERLGVWPAAILYYLFAAFELASGEANHPAVLASLTILYTLLTLCGALAFGESWYRQVEVFSVLFDLIGHFSPIERTDQGFALRPWGTGLLRGWGAGWDRVVFILLTLSSLAFDGLLATSFYQSLALDTSPLWINLGQLGSALFRAASMLVLTLGFLVVFAVVMRLVIYFGYVRVEATPTVTAFALTLVPIALVYNAAHNYSYLLVQSQYLFPLLSDPFGTGRPIAFTPNFALAGAAVVWYVQVVLIVIGHVIAVYLSHMRAGERFRTAKNALLSQYPMLLLMVGYTMTSLWILAQPTTRGG
ncbi:MAG TPA: hypothetical protein VF134_02720 [Candidatus Dormibacteraeota bacterium]